MFRCAGQAGGGPLMSNVRLHTRRMRHIQAAAVLFASFAVVAQDQPTSYEGVKALAMEGNYQAQRNLAYGYAAFQHKGQDKNPLLACAWYLVVLHSGSPKLNAGDIGNVQVYCDKLTSTMRAAADGQARVLFQQVYKREAKF
jgi:hypothetical protein